MRDKEVINVKRGSDDNKKDEDGVDYELRTKDPVYNLVELSRMRKSYRTPKQRNYLTHHLSS